MTHQEPQQQTPQPIEAGWHVARLRSVLMLVEQMAGRDAQPLDEDAVLDEGTALNAAYGRAVPVAQRRFQALAVETAGWAAAGVEALLAHQDALNPPRAAAAVLALELDRALVDLRRVLPA